jgi:hypothetical protein
MKDYSKFETWIRLLNRNTIVFLLYFLLIYICFFHLFTAKVTLKWDAIDGYLPFRYYLGYSLQHGELPLWNPFSGLGSPILADPQSASWYPPSWIIGYFFGYDFTMISVEYMLMLAIGGLGFYSLLKYIKISPPVAFMGGIAFLFSGLFISNAQHFTWITSGAYTPWIIYYFLKAGNEASLKSPVKGGIFLFLILTGGYPAFVIILFYFCLIYGTAILIKHFNMKDWKSMKICFRNYTVFAVSAILFALPFLSSYMLFADQFGRAGKISVVQMFVWPFPIKALISFLFPLSTIKIEYFNSDISMTNGYFGVITLIIFTAGIFLIRKKKEFFFLALFLFFLLTAFGEGFFIRRFLYDYVPMMGLFRFPSMFRLFFHMAAIIFAALIIDRIILEKDKNSIMVFKFTALLFLLVYIIIVVVSFKKQNIDFANFSIQLFLNNTSYLNIWACIFIQGGVQIIFIFILTITLFLTRRSYHRLTAVMILLFACEMTISARLQAYATVYNYEHWISVSKCNKAVKSLDNIDTYQDHLVSNYYNPLGLFTSMNNNIYYKRASFEMYNSFILNNYNSLWQKPYLIYMFKGPIAYITCITKLESDNFNGLKDSNFAVFYSAIPEFSDLSCSQHDSVYQVKMTPNQINLSANAQGPALLVIKQNYAKGWKAFVNDEEVKIYPVNESMMCLKLKKGAHRVQLRYKPDFINYCLTVSVFSLFAGLAFVAFRSFRS